MRKFYWYASAYLKKHGFVLLASVIIAVLFFSYFIPSIINFLEKRDRQYIAIVGQYNLLNLPESVKKQISAGLTSVNDDGSVSPLLAERWTVEQDGKTYRFVIKKGIYWQDGKELVPEDIQYRFNDVETITTPNDIVFTLPGSYAPFPSIVSEPLIRIEKKPYFFFFNRTDFIGIGDYKITNYKLKGNNLKELIVENQDKKYIYRFYLTEQDAVTAYKQGEVDILPELSQMYDVASWDTSILETRKATNRYLAIFFNVQHPFFAKNVRQSLAYSLEIPADKQATLGPIDPKSWAYLEGGKAYEKDLDRASERLLAELPPEALNMELTTTTEFEKEAEVIKEQWEAFGEKVYADCQASKNVTDKAECEKVKITVTVKISNFPDTSNFQALLIGQEIAPDPDQYYLWHSNEPTNFTGYKNTRIDNLLEKGRQTFDQQERKEIYQEFQQFFLEDAPAIFLYYLDSYTVRRK